MQIFTGRKTKWEMLIDVELFVLISQYYELGIMAYPSSVHIGIFKQKKRLDKWKTTHTKNLRRKKF